LFYIARDGLGISHNEVLILDTDNGQVRPLKEHRDTGSREILPVSGRNLLISGPHTSRTPDPIGDTLTPDVVDIETNARHPILTTDDWVVAAFPQTQSRPEPAQSASFTAKPPQSSENRPRSRALPTALT
jgi:hypothetical protein